ncbi:unnamed protein product, partial [Didymodactylos carnosus]
KTYSESLLDPEILIFDYSRMYISDNLHVAFQTLPYFKQTYGRAPKPWNDDDAEKFYVSASEINCKMSDNSITNKLDKHLIKLLAKICTGDLCPMQGVIGGTAAQEVIK